MPNEPPLRPATADEIAQTLSFALRFDGRKRVHTGDETMARITAGRLVQHVEQAGYVVMKRPPNPPPWAGPGPGNDRGGASALGRWRRKAQLQSA